MIHRMMGFFYQWVVVSWGWQRAVCAMGAGALGTLSMAPFGFLPALIVSLIVSVWLLDGAAVSTTVGTLWSAAKTGWWFGFGYFLAGLWWLGAAFLVEAERFAILMPLAILGLPMVLALFHALGFLLARLVWSRGVGRIFAFAWGLSASEWLRGHVLTGFPWNTYGMAFGEHLWLSQGASLVGLYGLTLITLLICALPATLITDKGLNVKPTLIAVIAFIGVLAVGAMRIPNAPTPSVANVKLRIMQPNLPQDAKFRHENRDAIMKRYLELSDRATSPTSTGVTDITHLIWPESAFPFILAKEPAALTKIGELLPPHVTLITGAATSRDPLPGERMPRYRNSIQVVSHEGTIIGSSDKAHLVPFGEYLPFADTLRALGLRQLIALTGGFEAGERLGTLSVVGLPLIAPLICYEAIFPHEVVAANELNPETRPQILLNVTNDAWFGNTPGPYQHFSQARLRAVEEGLPLIRAANSGISAVVDPYGRTKAALMINVEGVLDSNLPLSIESTVYARFGDLLFANGLFVCFLLASLIAWYRK
jgi:apolipoprotein N-acyltransferase